MVILLGASFAFIGLILWDLFTSRNEAQDYVNKDTSEKDWGFGQVVALVLLIGPLWTLLETFTGRRPPLKLLRMFGPDKSSQVSTMLWIMSREIGLQRTLRSKPVVN